jgi:hypothetical protein
LYSELEVISLDEGRLEIIRKGINNAKGVEKKSKSLSQSVFNLAFLIQKRTPKIIPAIIQKTGNINTYPNDADWSR